MWADPSFRVVTSTENATEEAKEFEFHHVFDEKSTQVDVFTEVKDVVESVAKGSVWSRIAGLRGVEARLPEMWTTGNFSVSPIHAWGVEICACCGGVPQLQWHHLCVRADWIWKDTFHGGLHL